MILLARDRPFFRVGCFARNSISTVTGNLAGLNHSSTTDIDANCPIGIPKREERCGLRQLIF